MTNSILALFPGQGSQSIGMGSDFIEASGKARELAEKADTVLGFSLSELCLTGPIEKLTLTENAQPALLLVSVICFREAEVSPLCAAGHSLGEYSAVVASGSMSFEDAIQLVHKRGRYMQEAVEPGAGKMIAVMGPSEEEIRELLSEHSEGVVEIANLNSPGQTVLAGDVTGIDGFTTSLKEKGAKVIPLNVSAPFHCSLMKSAEEKLAVDLDAISLSDPAFPIYSNVSAKPILTGEEVRKSLKEQVCSSVRWTESIQNAIAEHSISTTVEFGAGTVLTKLMKRIDKGVKGLRVENPKTLEGTLAELG